MPSKRSSASGAETGSVTSIGATVAPLAQRVSAVRAESCVCPAASSTVPDTRIASPGETLALPLAPSPCTTKIPSEVVASPSPFGSCR